MVDLSLPKRVSMMHRLRNTTQHLPVPCSGQGFKRLAVILAAIGDPEGHQLAFVIAVPPHERSLLAHGNPLQA